MKMYSMNRRLHATLAIWLGLITPELAGAERHARRNHHKLSIPEEVNGEDVVDHNPLREVDDLIAPVEDLEDRQKGQHVSAAESQQGGLIAGDLDDLLNERPDDMKDCAIIHQYAEPFQVADAIQFHPGHRAVELHMHGVAAQEGKEVPPVFKPGAIQDMSDDLSLAVEMYAYLTSMSGMVQVIPHGTMAKWTSKKKVPIAGFLCNHQGQHASAPVLHALGTPCVPTTIDSAGQSLGPDDRSYEVYIGTTRLKFDSKRQAIDFCEDYSKRIAGDAAATIWDASTLGETAPERSPSVSSFVALTRHLESPQGWTKGTKTVLAVVMDWKPYDKTLQPYSKQEADPIGHYKSVIFPRVNEAFREMSYGQFGIEVTVVPQVTRYTRDRVAYTSRKMPFPSLYEAAQESLEGQSSEYRFSDYDLVFVIAPQVNPTGTKGVAYVGQKAAMCNGCETLSDNFKVMVIVHELGHNLGLKHASSNSLEYGNVFDWMGNYPDVVGLHYGIGYKWFLNWVSSDNIYEIADADLAGLSSEVTINPFDTTTAPQAGQFVGVRISLSGMSRDVWVSFRATVASEKKGVYVTYQEKDEANSELVDAACGSISQQDAHLKEGWTFLEKSRQVAVKVVSISSTAAKVHVFAVSGGEVSALSGQPGFTDGQTRCPASCQDADLLVPQYSCGQLKSSGYCNGGSLTMMGHQYTIGGDICPATCGTCEGGSSASGGSSSSASDAPAPTPAPQTQSCKNVNVRINGKNCDQAAQSGWCKLETSAGQSVGSDLCPVSCGECPAYLAASDEAFQEPEITDSAGTASFVLGAVRVWASPGTAPVYVPSGSTALAPAPAAAGEFDCDAGLANWEAGWSDPKKEWCCKNEGKGWQGCKREKAEPFDCEAGLAKWETGWSEAKKEWCCENKEKGCQDTPFDCDAGFERWKTGWSEDKKEWCCENEKKGCPGEEQADKDEKFDCDAGDDKWEEGWSKDKKEYCCKTADKGCEPTDDLFDCQAGLERWKKGWSEAKKDWCCDNKKLGCVDKAFDCDAGLKKWKTGWSEKKKDWCCDNEEKGCEDGGDDDNSDDGDDDDDDESDGPENFTIADGALEGPAPAPAAAKPTKRPPGTTHAPARPRPTGPTLETDDSCKDDPYWLDSEGDGCSLYEETIKAGKWSQEKACEYDGAKMHCRSTCNTCEITSDTCADSTCVDEFMKTSGRCEQCADYSRHCNKDWFKRDCPLTCKVCSPSDEALEVETRSSASLGRPSVNVTGEDDCRDDECVADWKIAGKCVRCKDLGWSFCQNPKFSKSCPKTCNMCVKGGVPKNCQDVFSTYTCRRYKKFGWCEREDIGAQVRVQCPLSCGVCEGDGTAEGEDEPDAVDKRGIDDSDEKEKIENNKCTCAEEWSSAHHEGCASVSGCPAAACDGGNKPWCIVDNPGCATAEKARANEYWSYCKPDEKEEANEEEPKAARAPVWYKPWTWFGGEAYAAPDAPAPAKADPAPAPAPAGPAKPRPALGAPGSRYKWHAHSGASARKASVVGLMVAILAAVSAA